MGFLSSTCDTCGTEVWLFQKHSHRECFEEKQKKRVEQEDLMPIPNPPHDVSDYIYEKWLTNHKYPVERLHYHPHETKYTSREGRQALSGVDFEPSTKISGKFAVIPNRIIERGDSTYVECIEEDILIKLNNNYPSESIDRYTVHFLLDENPHESDQEGIQVYTSSFARVGTAYIKDSLVASRL